LEEGEFLGNIDAAILKRIKTPEELKEKNTQNAAELFQLLLATKMDAFNIDEVGDDDDNEWRDAVIFSSGVVANLTSCPSAKKLTDINNPLTVNDGDRC
jgi:hypothetical protein